MQLCYSFPGPLNLGLSLQYLHVPQSSHMHPVHTPQRFLFDFMFAVQREIEWHTVDWIICSYLLLNAHLHY